MNSNFTEEHSMCRGPVRRILEREVTHERLKKTEADGLLDRYVADWARPAAIVKNIATTL
jgi:hypothetical protein